jgi:hypothetical protein
MMVGQTPVGTGGGGTAQTIAASTQAAPSRLLQPSLDVLRQALRDTRVEKWKGSGATRDEAQANLASIQKDVASTLPSLLAAADAAPSSAGKAFAAYRNVEALYDVVLRVASAARLQAPGDQSAELDQALMALENGRKALGDRLESDTAAQEKQVSQLQAALKAVPPPPPPPVAAPPPVCPATPAKKKVTPAKPSSTTSSPGSSTPN